MKALRNCFIAFILVIIASLTSCSDVKEKQAAVRKKYEEGKANHYLSYFKDGRTNLCFAIRNGSEKDTGDERITSIACVPCDSVKHLLK